MGRGPRIRPPFFARRVSALGWILLGGLALRLLIAYVVLPGEGFGSDLNLFVRWAVSLGEHGPGQLYAGAGFVDYPPGYLWVLWGLGSVANGFEQLTGVPAAETLMSVVKLPAIAADLLIAFLLYRFGWSWKSRRGGQVAAALFLFIPVTWYDSALWGQVDSVGTLLLLGAVLLLLRGWSEPALATAMLATVTKPQLAIVLGVVGVVLLRRHLLQPGSGPRPRLRGWVAALDERLHGWFSHQQGPRRLIASLVAAAVAFVIVVAPFDLPALAPAHMAGIPFVGHVAGMLALMASAAGRYDVLTVNAFNPWALVGPTPLSRELARFHWTEDSLPVLGGISAATVGVALFLAVAVIVTLALLARDDRRTILLGITVLAVAFFVLPTRVHERYLFPAFATGALLAAVSVGFRWWYVLLGLVNVANLHAILTLPSVSAGPAARDLPFAGFVRQEYVIVVLALAHAGLFGWAFARLLRAVRWRHIALGVRAWAGVPDAEETAVTEAAAMPHATAPPEWAAVPSAGEASSRTNLLAVVAVLAVMVVAVQFSGLTDRPVGFYGDESSFAYNAWTIASSGVDEHDRPWPLFFEAFGDWKTGPYIYLLAGVFELTGPSILAARFVSALAGVLTVALLGSLAWRITRRPEAGLLTAVTALLLPWTFEPTRLALEVAIMPALLAAFLVALHAYPPSSGRWPSVVLLATLLALITYTYTLGRLLGPLLALGLLLYATRHHWRGVLAVWVAYGITLIPLALFALTRPDAATVRFDELGYFGRPLGEFVLTFAQQYLGNLDPVRWLLIGDPNQRHHAAGIMGSMLLGTLLLALFGLWVSLRRVSSDPWARFLIYGLLVSIVPASLTLDPFHVHRLIAVPIFVIALTIPAQAWLLAGGGGVEWRRPLLATLAIATLIQGVYFQLRYDEVARHRGGWFDAAYPGLLQQALATGEEPIYLVDGIVPGYIHAYWYGATWGIPAERFVHLPRDVRAPSGALVLSSERDCSPCEELAAGGFFRLYRVP